LTKRDDPTSYEWDTEDVGCNDDHVWGDCDGDACDMRWYCDGANWVSDKYV